MEWEYDNIFVLIPFGFVYHARTFIPHPSNNVVYNDNSCKQYLSYTKILAFTYSPNMNI